MKINNFTFYGDGSFSYIMGNPGKTQLYFGASYQFNVLDNIIFNIIKLWMFNAL